MGGQAYLSLENSEDPFLHGIKFTAMPPSKRFREMEQLSGGEKVHDASHHYTNTVFLCCCSCCTSPLRHSDVQMPWQLRLATNEGIRDSVTALWLPSVTSVADHAPCVCILTACGFWLALLPCSWVPCKCSPSFAQPLQRLLEPILLR